ncbi:uncharacterized protein METZ01_LOCUS344747, partial [marine metagenome]
QPQKSGAAKPTNVSTDPKRKMKENYFNRNKVVEGYKGTMDMSKSHPEAVKKVEKKIEDYAKKNPRVPGGKMGVKKEEFVNEAKDKKGKGSGTKDACYHKVKSRYSVWPSAYASGALVKCRKVGAANWGNKSKNEGFSPMQVAALEAAGMIDIKEGQKCWKGYEKKGTKMMFGKRYNNCVKKKKTRKEGVEFQEGSLDDFYKRNPDAPRPVKPKKEVELPKTPKPENKDEFKSGNEVGRRNVAKGVVYDTKTDQVKGRMSRQQSKNLAQKNVTGIGQLIRNRLNMSHELEGQEIIEAKKKLSTVSEDKLRLVKNGHTYKVVLTWRG